MHFVGGVPHSLGLGFPTSSRENMTNRLAAVGPFRGIVGAIRPAAIAAAYAPIDSRVP
jgi:hypothetical protein